MPLVTLLLMVSLKIYLGSAMQKVKTKLFSPGNCRQIDFLSVDVEGMELDVLQSSDWGRYKPRVVLVEQRMVSLEQSEASEIAQFMRSNGYLPYAKTANSVFYLLS